MWYIRPSEKQVGLWALWSGQLHPGPVQRYFTMRVSSNVFQVRGVLLVGTLRSFAGNHWCKSIGRAYVGRAYVGHGQRCYR
jgi:hypothetical protein